MKILVDLIKHSLRERLENRGGATHSLVKITIIYLDCLFSVVMWVGGFYILYSVFPAETFLQLSSTFLLSSLVLLVSRGFCSTAGSPLTIIRDRLVNLDVEEQGLIGGVATPAVLRHKEPARRITSPLLGALERKCLHLAGSLWH